jgi:acyl-CoA synthetase (AMP-forming)/AMP-acid ligase II
MGMITDRDICMCAYTQGLPRTALRVSMAMSRTVVLCSPGESLANIEKRMRQYKIRRLPVGREDGEIVGVLSLNDIACEAERENGGTETGYVTVASPDDRRACPGTIGRPLPGVDVMLLDDRRRSVPDGEVGELFARSFLTIEGYHDNDQARRASRFEGCGKSLDRRLHQPPASPAETGRGTQEEEPYGSERR